jgi:hypothetical protein
MNDDLTYDETKHPNYPFKALPPLVNPWSVPPDQRWSGPSTVSKRPIPHINGALCCRCLNCIAERQKAEKISAAPVSKKRS